MIKKALKSGLRKLGLDLVRTGGSGSVLPPDFGDEEKVKTKLPQMNTD